MLNFSYVRSAAGGKTLLGKAQTHTEGAYNKFFDERGVMDQEAFEGWIGSSVGSLMEKSE